MNWISIQDRLPDRNMDVLVVNTSGWMGVHRAIYQADYNVFVLYNPSSSEKYTLAITHWLEIPPQPKGG